MQNKSFASLLKQILDASEMDVKSAHALLTEQGVSISYSVLAAYRSFDSVPALERAKAILKAFDYPIDEDELIETLEHSRAEFKELKREKRSHISRGIRIQPEAISPKMDVDELEMLLDYRIKELFGNAGSLNMYITQLIHDDLTENGYVNSAQEDE